MVRGIGSALNAMIALPVMLVLLARSAVSGLWAFGVGRIAFVILMCWLALGGLGVILTAPDPLNAMWADPERVCREESPGSWPATKPVIKLSGCVSWTLGEMASDVGWDRADTWLRESYGTMVAGFTAGGLNRHYLLQGVLLTMWIPAVALYLPVAAVRYGVRWIS